ncbi:hypothetical protein [Holdemania massiliensis]|uniref:hypothetical protein n=1 Tax=Holdemania massiliensis TaxID=1468449 RepID=UPI001F05DBBB|nr:hypothetical protein [Holdemania massiliensis]MCH1940594.1 hypothetical protein [Holdemania massiliensis]
MDELLAAMYKVSVQLVPILGVAVLCFLIYLLRHCVTFIKELTAMVQKAGSAMEGVDKSIDKLQAPLDTVVRLSGTIDQVQESAVGAVKNMAGFMAGNLDSAKEAAAARTAKKRPAQPMEPTVVTPAESEEPITQSEGGTEHE